MKLKCLLPHRFHVARSGEELGMEGLEGGGPDFHTSLASGSSPSLELHLVLSILQASAPSPLVLL